MIIMINQNYLLSQWSTDDHADSLRVLPSQIFMLKSLGFSEETYFQISFGTQQLDP